VAIDRSRYFPPLDDNDYKIPQASETFVVYKNTISLAEVVHDRYYLSVRCGPEATTFKAIVVLIQSALETGHWIHGEVCEGAWSYHSLALSSAADDDDDTHRRQLLSHTADDGVDGNATTHLRFVVDRLDGSLAFTVREAHAPIKIAPPYAILDAPTYEAEDDDYDDAAVQGRKVNATSIEICDVDSSLIYYVGILGDNGCAVYQLKAEKFYGSCTKVKQTVDGSFGNTADIQQLHSEVELRSTCSAGAYQDFFVEIDAEHEHDNLIFEVTDIDATTEGLAPTALDVRGYDNGETPTANNHQSTRGSDNSGTSGVYSVAISSHDMKAGIYYISVGCRTSMIRFKIVAILLKSELTVGTVTHGEVCPDEW
jgi:hypothetical protein